MRNALDFYKPNQLFWGPQFLDLVDDFFAPTKERLNFVPAVEVGETEKAYLVTVDVPGLAKEDVKIEVLGDLLKISGERKFEKTENKKYHVMERTFGRFERTITLPENVDIEKVEAVHSDGVLKIALPKTEAVKAKVVSVKTGEAKEGFFAKFTGHNKNEQ